MTHLCLKRTLTLMGGKKIKNNIFCLGLLAFLISKYGNNALVLLDFFILFRRNGGLLAPQALHSRPLPLSPWTGAQPDFRLQCSNVIGRTSMSGCGIILVQPLKP